MANNDGKTGFLNEGSTVEVRIEGAWYQADIVTLCAKSKDQFRVLRRRSHLVEDLVEIRISSIRPLPPPPPADQSYEPRDVVDVFVDYGWWKGVVSGVYTFKGEAIYTVFLFENPPYFQDRVFKCEEIRFHWVWTYDGRWVRPPKPQEIPGIGEECSTLEQSNPVTATSMGKKLNTPTPETMANNDNQIGFLSEGSEVEVAIEGVWYASDIVTQCPKSKDQFRVLCRRRYFEENLLNVNISSIRPRPPPPAADQSYEPRDVVDVLHRYGWWKGVVSEVHILKGQTRYTVVLFGNLPHFEDKIFTSEEMRFHWVWTHDSKWVRLPKSTEIPGLGEKSLRLEQLIPVTGTSTGKSPNAPATESMVDSENQIEFLSEGSTVEVKNEGAWYEANIITQCAKSKDRFCVLFRDRRSWYKHKMLNFHISSIRPHPPPPAAEQGYEPLDVVDAFVCHGWWKGVVTEVDTLEGKTNATKLYSVTLFENPPELAKQIFTSQELRFHWVWTADGNWVRPPKTKNANQQAAGQKKSAAKSSKKRLRELNAQHTNQWIGAEDNTNDGSSKVIKRRNYDRAQIEIERNDDTPFRKTSHLWKEIDSLEVFRVLPQNPHFSPLMDCNEDTREGMAMGHMWNFASLAEKVCRLQTEDPMSLFQRYLEALALLETVGFDVKAVGNRINELLALKTKQEELKSNSQQFHNEIVECDDKEARLEVELSAINDKMRELEEKRAKIQSRKAKAGARRIFLQTLTSTVKDDLLRIREMFKVKAGAPW